MRGRLHEEFGFLSIQLMRPTVAAAIWDLAEENQLQAILPSFAEGTLRLYGRLDQQSLWERSLTQLAADGYVKSYRFDPDLVPLELWSPEAPEEDRGADSVALLHKVIENLAHSSILVTMGAATGGRMILAIARKYREETHQALERITK